VRKEQKERELTTTNSETGGGERRSLCASLLLSLFNLWEKQGTLGLIGNNSPTVKRVVKTRDGKTRVTNSQFYNTVS